MLTPTSCTLAEVGWRTGPGRHSHADILVCFLFLVKSWPGQSQPAVQLRKRNLVGVRVQKLCTLILCLLLFIGIVAPRGANAFPMKWRYDIGLKNLYHLTWSWALLRGYAALEDKESRRKHIAKTNCHMYQFGRVCWDVLGFVCFVWGLL
jgi:hypothetical protein